MANTLGNAAGRLAAMTDSGPSDELVEAAHQMFDLARQGEADLLMAHVDAGVPADLTDADGNTLLMLGAYHGHAAVVAGLAERGADVNRLNDRGQSPLARSGVQGGGRGGRHPARSGCRSGRRDPQCTADRGHVWSISLTGTVT